jgi:hypothetical protein
VKSPAVEAFIAAKRKNNHGRITRCSVVVNQRTVRRDRRLTKTSGQQNPYSAVVPLVVGVTLVSVPPPAL